MQPGIRDLTVAVHALTVEADRLTTNYRAIAVHDDVPLATVQHRVERAVADGLIVHEPKLANTIRLAPGITVHNGTVYRLQTL